MTISPDAYVTALNTITAAWPAIKNSLEAKRAVDAAYAKVDDHQAAIDALSREMDAFLKKSSSFFGILMINKKKKEKDLTTQISIERQKVTDLLSEAVSMSSKFESLKGSFDILESNFSIILQEIKKAVDGDPKLLADLNTLRDSRIALDEAKRNLTPSTKSLALLISARDEADATRRKLIEEYPGDGYESNPFGNDMSASAESYVDPESQRAAIYASASIDEKINQAFELDTSIPPHRLNPKTIDPESTTFRRRNAVVVQNAVHRLDDLIQNLDRSISYLSARVSKYQKDVVLMPKKVRESGEKVWKIGEEKFGSKTGDEVKERLPDIFDSIRAVLVI
ncbi:hypothetical protein HDU67_007580 [Dinochytrium kinnereticum]|nr:hypothetical protein HDU67_007580 [Dinochytrium kinnereticum]